MTVCVSFVCVTSSALAWIEKNRERFVSFLHEELTEAEGRKLMKELGLKRADLEPIGVEEEDLDEALAALGTSGKPGEMITMSPAAVKAAKMPAVLADEKEIHRLFAAAARRGDHVVIEIGNVG